MTSSAGKPVSEFISDWPYTPQYLQETLDPDLIALQGQALLRRALNGGRVVGFVSSGVSMSYGRLGWGNLVLTLDRMTKEAAKGPSCSPLARRFGPMVPGEQAKRMREVLEDLKLDTRQPGDDLHSGRYPAAFQFLEQIVLEGIAGSERQSTSDKSENPLRAAAKALLHDDWGHAHVMAIDLLRDLVELEGASSSPNDKDQAGASGSAGQDERLVKDPLQRLDGEWAALVSEVPSGQSEAPDLRAGDAFLRDREGNTRQRAAAEWRNLFDRERGLWHSADRVGNEFGKPVAALVRSLLEQVEAAIAADGNTVGPLAPLHRFVIPALMRLWRHTGTPGPARDEPLQSGRRARSHTVPPPRDPLMILARDLGIRRFATTNYDLDLERLLDDLGFKVSRISNPSSVTTSNNALGARARGSVFGVERSADLVHFAVQHGEYAIEVMHLHGRAARGEPIVVTERDYQSLYLQRGPIAEVVNDAIELMFGSNPILFVGSGMSEDDILRPLRQFVAERKSQIDRSAVVLLPAEGSRARQIEETIAHYNRYGVYTMHFGLGKGNSDKGKIAMPEVRWLAEAIELVGCLGRVLEALDDCCQKATKRKDVRGRIKGIVEAFGASRADASRPVVTLDKEMQGPSSPKHPMRSVRLPAEIRGLAVESLGLGGNRSPVEFELLNAVLQTTRDLLDQWLDCGIWLERRWFDGAKLSLPSSTPKTRLRPAWPLIRCLRALLSGLPDALRGLALCLELAALRDGWRHWKIADDAKHRARPVGALRHRADHDNRSWELLSRDTFALPPRRQLVSGRQGPAGPHGPIPLTDRFCNQAPSRTFQDFIDALCADAEWQSKTNEGPKPGVGGRRAYVLLARRGVGKGHFFEMMASKERVLAFIKASWSGREPPKYAATMYVKLGLSLEVFSAIDRLILVLIDMAPRVFQPVPADAATSEAGSCPVRQIWTAWNKLKLNRIPCLRAILRLYAENADAARERLLITFSGFGVLFDKQGNPKNAMIHRLVDSLLGKASGRVPIDILMLCSDATVPRMFTRRAAQGMELEFAELDGWSRRLTLELRQVVQPTISERGRRRAESLCSRLELNVTQGWQGSQVGLHILRGAHAKSTVSKYFPEVALALAAAPDYLLGSDMGRDTGPSIKFKEGALRKLQRDILKVLDSGDSADRSEVESLRSPKTLLQILLGHLDKFLPRKVKSNAEGDRPPHAPGDSDSEGLERPSDKIDRAFELLYRITQRNRFLLTIVCAAASEQGWVGSNEAGPAQYHAGRVLDWLIALIADLSPRLPSDRGDMTIARVLDAFRAGHERGRPMPRFFAFDDPTSSIGKAVATLQASTKIPLHKPDAIAARMREALRGPLGWRLQERLLWHLAVMGLSAQSDVLSMAPLIQEDCRQIAVWVLHCDESELSEDELRAAIGPALVEVALDLLVHRCLVFRQSPVRLGPPEVQQLWSTVDDEVPTLGYKEWLAASQDSQVGRDVEGREREHRLFDSGWRFAIHSFMQRSILKYLDAPSVELAHVDQFGLSLWASQPDELPRPNQTAANDIAELVAAWTGFPRTAAVIRKVSALHWARDEAEKAASSLSEPAQGDLTPGDSANDRGIDERKRWRTATLPSRMLRAAFSVVRTVYALGVVARFDDFQHQAPEAGPPEGHFEQHRLQVRWLLDQAAKLQTRPALKALLKSTADSAPGRPRRESANRWGLAMEALAPFFVDELVWLHNECGLFGLVQGRLDHASAMFGRALHFVRQVEGEETRGALWCRIHLNLAICDIERGRIREAAAYLQAIVDVADENPILRILARGFQGLVEHYGGNLDVAERIYRDAIADLNRLGHSRSVAIFSRHLAELYRVRGAEMASKALQAIDQSIAAATKGGHEDIRQLANLSRARLAIAKVLPHDVLQKEVRLIQHNLDAVESYGLAMGMPRLAADTAFARALFLLDLGETRHAAGLAYACLGAANMNDLRLRQMTALALLGRIYERRGMREMAEPLLSRAYTLAYRCNYSNMRESVPRNTGLHAPPLSP